MSEKKDKPIYANVGEAEPIKIVAPEQQVDAADEVVASDEIVAPAGLPSVVLANAECKSSEPARSLPAEQTLATTGNAAPEWLRRFARKPAICIVIYAVASIGGAVLQKFPELLDDRTQWLLRQLGFREKRDAMFYTGIRLISLAVWLLVAINVSFGMVGSRTFLGSVAAEVLMFTFVGWVLPNFCLATWRTDWLLSRQAATSLPRRLRASALTTFAATAFLALAALQLGPAVMKLYISGLCQGMHLPYVPQVEHLIRQGLLIITAQALLKISVVQALAGHLAVQLVFVGYAGYVTGFIHWLINRKQSFKKRALWFAALVGGCFMPLPVVSLAYTLCNTKLFRPAARAWLFVFPFAALWLLAPGAAPFSLQSDNSFISIIPILLFPISLLTFVGLALDGAWKTGKVCGNPTAPTTVATEQIGAAPLFDNSPEPRQTKSTLRSMIPAAVLIVSTVALCAVLNNEAIRPFPTTPKSIATASATMTQPVVFARRTIDEGELFDASSLQVRYVLPSEVPPHAVQKLDTQKDAAFIARKFIPAGTALTQANIKLDEPAQSK